MLLFNRLKLKKWKLFILVLKSSSKLPLIPISQHSSIVIIIIICRVVI